MKFKVRNLTLSTWETGYRLTEEGKIVVPQGGSLDHKIVVLYDTTYEDKLGRSLFVGDVVMFESKKHLIYYSSYYLAFCVVLYQDSIDYLSDKFDESDAKMVAELGEDEILWVSNIYDNTRLN